MTNPSATRDARMGKAAIAAGVAVLAVVALYLAGLIGPAKEHGGDPLDSSHDSAALQPVPDGQPAPQQAETAGQAAETPPAPQIDIFRLQPDGEALIAGQAAPGWTIQILLDGTVHSSATPGSDGKFATFLSLPNAAGPRVLSLRMLHADDRTQIEGTQQIVVAPAPSAPVVAVAAASEQPALAVIDPADTAAPLPEENIVDAAAAADIGSGAATPQVSGEAPKIVMMTDADGARVLQTPDTATAPRVLSNVALDTISYSSDGGVQLAGRAVGQGSVRVYLDNRPITLSPIAADGTWRTSLPKVDAGVYTLRIDELTPSGTVASRVETPFKREDRTLLAELQDTGTPDQDTPAADTQPQTIRVMTVQPGNTLWAISRETYGEGLLYVRVFEANAERIRNPDLIYPGQVFSLPD